MKKVWIKGPRVETGRTGKNHGPVIAQLVVLVLIPKGATQSFGAST